jgi:deazaflavin-dependent oxidoreductase (nitroreductase family)
MVDTGTAAPKLPPPWFIHTFWKGHRLLNRLSGHRLLWPPGGKRGWGAMELTAVGRRSGEPRRVIIAYLEDGPNLLAMAMNGWDEGHPAWWLNVQANPDVVVRLPGQAPRPVHAREATGEERERLRQQWAEVDEDLDGYAAKRTTPPAFIVFEPRDEDAPAA